MNTPNAWLTLCLLGGCEISRSSAPVHLETAKTTALLAYLAMKPGQHERHKLAGLLWGSLPEPNAHRALRHALWDLRRTVCEPARAPTLLITTRTVAFNPQSGHWLDASTFLQQVHCGAYEQAVELYHGDLLDGFYVSDAPAFEEWLLAEREHLRQLLILALQRLVQQSTIETEFATGLAYAHRLTALNPWDEEAHRCTMRLLALSGQRSAALMQYETCRRILATELGVELSDETQHLYDQIRTETLGRDGAEEVKCYPAGASQAGCSAPASRSSSATTRSSSSTNGLGPKRR